MVDLAETHRTVGIVGSYQLSGGSEKWYVRTDGLPFHSAVVPGREICRAHFLSSISVFGNPTSNLYRSDLIRKSDAFYPNSSAEADVSACFESLRETDFGFVHQVLSFNREGGDDSRTTGFLQRVNSYPVADIEELVKYGPAYLTKQECDSHLKKAVSDYYKFLAQSVLARRNKEFWDYHRSRLKVVDMKIDKFRLARNVLYRIADYVFNPKRTIERLFKKLFKRNRPASPKPQPTVRAQSQAQGTGA